MPLAAPSLAPEEIARFAAHADAWWDLEGPFRPLHRLNPLRVGYVRDQICGFWPRKPGDRLSLGGIKVLDVGCGGGLLAEPLARLGAKVTGLDASPEAIAAAKKHAKTMRLAIDYRVGSAESMAAGGLRFDVITALEVVEHVADVGSFLAALAQLLKPGGLLIMSTLSRTPRSFLLGIVAAEYILGWVPRGTHDWRQFIRPSELVERLAKTGLKTVDLTGMVFHQLRGAFVLKKHDLAVNYLLTARRAV